MRRVDAEVSVTSELVKNRGRGRSPIVLAENHSIGEMAEILMPETFIPGAVGHLDIEVGATVNMTDFNSARISVRLSLPIPGDLDAANMAYPILKDWCDGRVSEEVAAYRRLLDQGKTWR